MRKVVNILTLVILATCFAAPPSDAGYLRGEHYSLDELYRAIESIKVKNPELVRIKQFGTSIEGRPMPTIIIARNDSVKRPEVLITANIHAMEFTGDRLALAIAEKLVENDGDDEWVTELIDKMDFHILPLINPDGYARASKNLDRGFTVRRTNAHSVDLNRNFPHPKGVEPVNFLAGSRMRISPNYMGPRPLSEPETAALDRYVRQHGFFVSINLHTAGGYFLYPWGFMPEACPQRGEYIRMGRVFNSKQNKCKYKVMQSFDWYQTVGDLDDWLYARYGALSLTVEVSRKNMRLVNPIRFVNPFWWYNPVNIKEWTDNDRDATLSAIATAYKLTGGIPYPPKYIEWVLPADYEQFLQ